MINLKCDGVKLWGDGQTKRRYEQTLKRIEPYFKNEPFGDTVLNVDGRSEFGKKLADDLGLEFYYTNIDLNRRVGYKSYDYIFATEVIEHLLNSLWFLEHLHFNKYLFLTYPYSPILQGARHFHEMTDAQFYTLIDEVGLRIVEHSKFRNLNTLRIIFSGVRPIIKAFMQIVGLSYINFYVLGKK